MCLGGGFFRWYQIVFKTCRFWQKGLPKLLRRSYVAPNNN
ncbi:sodium/solute symporter family protein (fragment) [Candidatus Cloacimonas acidaminovorans str. Evry]|uniref:Sodium/solute symporter family protein n=1 Tax=Cloacimonas acidaminovorans (strain Evry) TaxID=459349 RepID=B0VF90_CLOAI